VQNADSLASIAAHFSTTTSVLRSLNRLMSDLVYPGQVQISCIYLPCLRLLSQILKCFWLLHQILLLFWMSFALY